MTPPITYEMLKQNSRISKENLKAIGYFLAEEIYLTKKKAIEIAKSMRWDNMSEALLSFKDNKTFKKKAEFYKLKNSNYQEYSEKLAVIFMDLYEGHSIKHTLLAKLLKQLKRND